MKRRDGRIMEKSEKEKQLPLTHPLKNECENHAHLVNKLENEKIGNLEK